MAAFLEKSTGSEGFHQRTAEASTNTDGEVTITAIIDGQSKTITEASLRRHLKLEDHDGITSIPNSEIFEQLALIGYQTDSDKKSAQVVLSDDEENDSSTRGVLPEKLVVLLVELYMAEGVKEAQEVVEFIQAGPRKFKEGVCVTCSCAISDQLEWVLWYAPWLSDQLEWVLWYAPWLSDQLEWICGMLHGLVINWSSSAIETSRNRVNGIQFETNDARRSG
ncbi:hypothetical protein Tco_0692864 [Tanacetum coccineum]